MAKLTKRQKAIKSMIVAGKAYGIEDAVNVLTSLPAAKFKESIDIAVNLGVDPRKSDQVVRGASVLPNGTGKTVRVAVFAQGANAEAAKAAGADVVGFDDLATSIQGGNLDFDVVIATPDAMRVVGKLGTILGPRGLMPNPKVGTVTADVATAVKNAKSGQVRYRVGYDGLLEMLAGIMLGLLADVEMRDRSMIPHHPRPYLAPGPLDCCVCLRHICVDYFLCFDDGVFF